MVRRGRARRGLAVVLCAAAWLGLAGGTAGAAAPSFLDKPLKTTRLPLPADPQNPQAKPLLSCAYYPHFMVKQIDLGEKGADQLSILPIADSKAPPACQRDNVATEKIISADWAGYFRGAKGDYVFFDADDGWNEGVGFAIFTPDGKKIFDDVARKWHAAALTPSGLAMRYQRVYGAKCSLRADEVGCWRQIRDDTGLAEGSPPDCRAAYEREQKRTPKFAQEVLNDPTIVDYEVAVAIDGGGAKFTPVSGKPLRCRPSE